MPEDKPVEEMTREEIMARILKIELEILQAKREQLYRAGIFERPKQ